jgi:rhamnosyltransferase
MKIDALIVLFNPNISVLSNILTYLPFVETLYLIDNSEKKNFQLIQEIKNLSTQCIYIDNNGNKGIANALNLGAQLAIQNNADWLLTMDQDSRFEDNNLASLIRCASISNMSTIGIVSPLHILEHSYNKFLPVKRISEVLMVMTSGNLLNLAIYQQIGGFIDKLFIDAVDHEYCLRLNFRGFKVVQCEYASLRHCLGDLREIYLGIKTIRYSIHSPLRRYYITRNRLYLLKKYGFKFPSLWFKIIKSIIFEWIKIILLEKEKIAKSQATIEGTIDFFRGKYGKYNS